MVALGYCCSTDCIKKCLGEFSAEFLGTFLLVFMGDSAVAEAVLSGGQGGNAVTIYVGYGLGLFLGILVSGSVSGGHLNPAVTVAGAIVKRFKWSKVFHYMVAQYLGAFVGACLTYLVYIDTFNALHDQFGMNVTTASVFATYTKDHVTVFGSFVDQILGAMVLVLAIYAATDERGAKAPAFVVPAYVTLALIGIGCSLGINHGFAVNPARDFSPRLFTYLAGWGPQVFASEHHWYVPILGPHIGALLGAVIYVLLVDKLRVDHDNRSYLPPPEIKEFAAYQNPVLVLNDEYTPRKGEAYTCYL